MRRLSRTTTTARATPKTPARIRHRPLHVTELVPCVIFLLAGTLGADIESFLATPL